MQKQFIPFSAPNRPFKHSDEWREEMEALIGNLIIQVATLKTKIHILENKGYSS